MMQDQPSTAQPLIAYDLTEAARQVCLSVDTLRDAIKERSLTARLVGRKYLVRHSDLCAWVDNLPTTEAGA
jgi:excisionase family DNA binding protein